MPGLEVREGDCLGGPAGVQEGAPGGVGDGEHRSQV